MESLAGRCDREHTLFSEAKFEAESRFAGGWTILLREKMLVQFQSTHQKSVNQLFLILITLLLFYYYYELLLTTSLWGVICRRCLQQKATEH